MEINNLDDLNSLRSAPQLSKVQTKQLLEELEAKIIDADWITIGIMAPSDVDAIGALKSVHWKRRARALVIAIPTIHVLNGFRNAGIVWLTDTYPTWSLAGMGIFDFAHSYAAKVASLFAMFLMALALFDLLPEP